MTDNTSPTPFNEPRLLDAITGGVPIRYSWRHGKNCQPTWLYVIRAGETGPVKIGTSDDPEGRLKHLQSGHYEELRLLCMVRGCVHIESLVHEELFFYRLRREWFSFEGRTRVVVEALCLIEEREVVERIEEAAA